MPINVKQSQGSNKSYDYGWEDGETYFARVVQIVDLGLQDGGEYQGSPKPDAEKILFTFEFPDVRNEEGKPAWLSVNLALPQRWEDGGFKGMHVKSNLLKYLDVLYPEGLYRGGKNPNYVTFGHGFDWSRILGRPAQLTITTRETDGKVKAYIKTSSMSKVPKKFVDSVGELENEPMVVDVTTATAEQWSKLFPWVRNVISESLDEAVAARARELNTEVEGMAENGSESVSEAPKKVKPKKTKPEVEEEPFDDDLPF